VNLKGSYARHIGAASGFACLQTQLRSQPSPEADLPRTLATSEFKQ